MQKEKILKNLLKTLLENRINELEVKYTQEMKDINLTKKLISNEQTFLKSLIISIKKPEQKKKTLSKQKTNNNKLISSIRHSRVQTPMHMKFESQNIQNINSKKIINNKTDNFSHLQKSKIDGNYKTKNKNGNIMNKSAFNNINNSKNKNEKIKKYKTPVRRLYQTTLNSIAKYKKFKSKNVPVTPSTSFYNDFSSISYKQIENNDGIVYKKRKSKTELLDSIINANKSYIFNKSSNVINRSNFNIKINKKNNNNNSTYNSGNNSNFKKEINPCTSSLKKNIKFSNIDKKNKTNLFLEQFIDKENMNNNNYKFIFNRNYGDWLTSEDGEDVLISISNYLDTKTKYNLFSCKKKYLKYLYQTLNDKYTEFKEKNKINPNSNTLKEKINEIKEKYSEDDLNLNNTKFILSRGTLKALEILNKDEKEHEKFFDIKNYNLFSDDIYIVYQIIFQLIENNDVKNSSGKKEFFEKMGEFIYYHINENNKIGDIFKNMVKEFQFNKENIYKIKNIIKGKEEKLKPLNYSQICKTTGLVIFLVKDILEYLGLNSKENKKIPIIKLMNLEFFEEVKTKLPNYLKFLEILYKK